MDNRKRLSELSRAIEARESGRGYNIVVAFPAGLEGEQRPPGVYTEAPGSLTVIYEGSDPDPKIMQAIAAKMAPFGVTVICEPDEDSPLVDSEA